MTERFDLRSARLNAGLSIRGLTVVTGVNGKTISQLERGESAHPASAKKIADYFGVQVTDLMPLTDDLSDLFLFAKEQAA